ncbi:MAG: hypothetical protein COY40_03390 [Alphaproteobacteria bacterium CG_4_10_14_0_8_um_filter_53_9]|nr:MAG: hypothetical protein COY40_03390 [Alphaproteobacteria bacterium CG_4_10_14_0_8_um_filter_53_9]
MPPKKTTPKTKTSAIKTPKAKAAKATQVPTGQMSLNFAHYPDFAMAIAMLKKRHAGATGQTQKLIGSWVDELTTIQSQITKLKKLEGLTSAVSRPIPMDE